MGCCWPEEVCNRLSKELVKGQEWAIQLKNLLQRAPQQLGDEDDGSVVPTTVDLAVKIFTSFTESLSVLNANSNSNSNSNSAHPDESTGGDGVCHQNEIMKTEPSHLDHSYCDERSLEDSGESKKKSSSVIRDRRGCYKRRKASHSWKIITAVIDDGQAWRKYGQKNILNSLYPRSYFRCTRKFDENCKANKQVQQIQDNPRMYETTYIGQHTCSNVLIKSTLPQVILKDSDQDWKSNSNHMIFTTPGQTRIVNYKADTTKHLMTSSSRQSVIKKDMSITKEEGSTPNDHLSDNLSSMDNNNNNNNNNYISWSDLEAFDLSEPTIFKSFPKMVSENEDVVNFYDVLMSRDDW